MFISLAYHSVSDQPYAYAVTPEVFEQQMRVLQRRFTCVSLAQALAILKAGDFGKNYAVVTFDDGLQDNLKYAYPILQKLHIPAAIFVPTVYIGSHIINKTTGLRFDVLTLEEMQRLEREGLVAIESHSHTHPVLSELSEAEIREECEASFKALAPVWRERLSRCFAYPKGKYNALVQSVLRDYVSYAFGNEGVLLPGDAAELYAVPRVIIRKKDSLLRFRAMCSPWYWRAKRLKQWFKKG